MTTEFTKEEIKLLKDHFNENIGDFIHDFMKHHLTNKVPEFHNEIYNLLMTKNRVVLAAPRGFAKSNLCSVFYPLWCALFEKKKDICIISASEGLAIEWLRKIRYELENNRSLIKWFGDLISDKWTENHIILANKSRVNIRARGAEAQIRGFRPDVIILDDIETDESVVSEDRRNTLRDWVYKSCINTLLKDGQFIWIGTILSPLSLLQEALDNDNKWEKRKYKAYFDGIEGEGHELWKEHWNHKRLQQRKYEIGSFRFYSEFMNDPVSSDKAPIKSTQIRLWKELPTQLSAVIAIDPAYSEDDKADFKTASLVGIDAQMNRYLISYIRTHAPSGEFIDMVLNLYLNNKGIITGVGLPKSGTEHEFWKSFTGRAELRKIYPPMVEVKNAFTDSERTIRKKTNRIVAALQPLFENGKYYIHETHTEAKDELLSIGCSRWDDIVDSLCYAEQILSPGYYEDSARTSNNRTVTKERANFGEYAYGL